jgi:hypothetical protein
MPIKRILVTAILAAFYIIPVVGQNNNIKDKATRVYLDCSYCDNEHIKKEITFVNYMRDRKDAQVHILTTHEYTGAGGTKYTFFFIGQKEFTGQADTLNFSVPADAMHEEIRAKQINILKLGLTRYVAKTPFADKLNISFSDDKESIEDVTDKWNSWVFELNASGYFDVEQSYKFLNGWSSASAQRVTEKLKTEFFLNYSFSESSYIFDDTTIISTSSNKSFRHLLVKSINDHWSYGYTINISSSLYQNIDISTLVYPAIEYNIFPYSESNRRQLRILYGAGIRQYDYIDSTIYNQTNEILFGQKLGVAIQIKEKWGSISSSLEGSQYFHDISLKRLSFYTSLNLRLYKGLSLRIHGGVSMVHDQLNLAKGEVSNEDVLLRRRQIASQYNYWGSVGLSYSFGSIYNNVVNPRFGN